MAKKYLWVMAKKYLWVMAKKYSPNQAIVFEGVVGSRKCFSLIKLAKMFFLLLKVFSLYKKQVFQMYFYSIGLSHV